MLLRSLTRLVAIGCLLVLGAGAQERLDAEHKCAEAEQYYRKALAAAPSSAPLFNNAGNYYLVCGSLEQARAAFERVLKVAPAHVNANLQLARLAIGRKEPGKALDYLSRLGDRDPEVVLAHAEALAQTGRRDAALALLDTLTTNAKGDPRLLFTLGMSCGRIGFYDRAEAAFTAVLVRYPDDYDALYNLGLAAARAEHYDRARSAFESALKARPGDVDSMYQLGRVHSSLEDYPRAVYLLAQAGKRAPARPDVTLALARAAQMAGYYGDALLAYDDYLKLRPGDDMVRRDWALLHGYTRNGLEQGLRELNRYVRKYPDDAVGFYDLAQLTDKVDRAQALAHVSTATKLNPGLEPARFLRASLLEKLGRHEESLAESEAAIRLNPRDARAFDLLGLDYLSLDRPAEAESALRKAASLAPEDPDILFHLSRSLIELGRTKEAQPLLERFQKMRRQTTPGPREEPGVIESATLTRAERAARVIERLRQLARAQPDDASLKLNLASALLSEGKAAEAEAAFQELLAMNPAAIANEAGTTLLRFEQYAPARDFLERASKDRPQARLDLAMALFFTGGPGQAMQVLEQIPEGQEAGDVLLMRARILDAAGQFAEADKSLEKALGYTEDYSVARPRLAEEAALLLVRHGRGAEALDLLGRTLKSAPGDPGLLLTKVAVLTSLGRSAEAEKAVKQIESRWPEWDRPYVVEALLLERGSRIPEAQQRIRIALALGSREPAARCALARMTSPPSAADPKCACQPGIYEVFFPPCK